MNKALWLLVLASCLLWTAEAGFQQCPKYDDPTDDKPGEQECGGHGTCITYSGDSCDMRCKCTSPYCGNDCSINADIVVGLNEVCCPNNCNGNGNCTSTLDGGTGCVCKDGFYGLDCSLGSPRPCSHPKITRTQTAEEIKKEFETQFGKDPLPPTTANANGDVPDAASQAGQGPKQQRRESDSLGAVSEDTQGGNLASSEPNEGNSDRRQAGLDYPGSGYDVASKAAKVLGTLGESLNAKPTPTPAPSTGHAVVGGGSVADQISDLVHNAGYGKTFDNAVHEAEKTTSKQRDIPTPTPTPAAGAETSAISELQAKNQNLEEMMKKQQDTNAHLLEEMKKQNEQLKHELEMKDEVHKLQEEKLAAQGHNHLRKVRHHHRKEG